MKIYLVIDDTYFDSTENRIKGMYTCRKCAEVLKNEGKPVWQIIELVAWPCDTRNPNRHKRD